MFTWIEKHRYTMYIGHNIAGRDILTTNLILSNLELQIEGLFVNKKIDNQQYNALRCYTAHDALGCWLGTRENSTIIEFIVNYDLIPVSVFDSIIESLKSILRQDEILLTEDYLNANI